MHPKKVRHKPIRCRLIVTAIQHHQTSPRLCEPRTILKTSPYLRSFGLNMQILALKKRIVSMTWLQLLDDFTEVMYFENWPLWPSKYAEIVKTYTLTTSQELCTQFRFNDKMFNLAHLHATFSLSNSNEVRAFT